MSYIASEIEEMDEQKFRCIIGVEQAIEDDDTFLNKYKELRSNPTPELEALVETAKLEYPEFNFALTQIIALHTKETDEEGEFIDTKYSCIINGREYEVDQGEISLETQDFEKMINHLLNNLKIGESTIFFSDTMVTVKLENKDLGKGAKDYAVPIESYELYALLEIMQEKYMGEINQMWIGICDSFGSKAGSTITNKDELKRISDEMLEYADSQMPNQVTKLKMYVHYFDEWCNNFGEKNIGPKLKNDSIQLKAGIKLYERIMDQFNPLEKRYNKIAKQLGKVKKIEKKHKKTINRVLSDAVTLYNEVDSSMAHLKRYLLFKTYAFARKVKNTQSQYFS